MQGASGTRAPPEGHHPRVRAQLFLCLQNDFGGSFSQRAWEKWQVWARRFSWKEMDPPGVGEAQAPGGRSVWAHAFAGGRSLRLLHLLASFCRAPGSVFGHQGTREPMKVAAATHGQGGLSSKGIETAGTMLSNASVRPSWGAGDPNRRPALLRALDGGGFGLQFCSPHTENQTQRGSRGSTQGGHREGRGPKLGACVATGRGGDLAWEPAQSLLGVKTWKGRAYGRRPAQAPAGDPITTDPTGVNASCLLHY